MMVNRCFSRVLCPVFLACGLSALSGQAAKPGDGKALLGISVARGGFDVSRFRADSPLGAMKPIAENRDGLVRPAGNAPISLIASQLKGYALVPRY